MQAQRSPSSLLPWGVYGYKMRVPGGMELKPVTSAHPASPERTPYVKAPPGTYCYCREFGVLCALCCGSSCLETSYFTAGQLRL
jgi:hypothetical protein